jgi:hypothetical protein
VAALSTRVTVTLQDRYKNEIRIVFHVAAGIVDPNDATVQAVVTAINNCINPVGLHVELTQVDAVTGSGIVGADYVCTDKAVFPALDEDGQPHNFKVPALLPSILEADGVTVDMANADVVAYVEAVTTNAQGRNGVAITAMNSGYRWASRKPLKN